MAAADAALAMANSPQTGVLRVASQGEPAQATRLRTLSWHGASVRGDPRPPDCRTICSMTCCTTPPAGWPMLQGSAWSACWAWERRHQKVVPKNLSFDLLPACSDAKQLCRGKPLDFHCRQRLQEQPACHAPEHDSDAPAVFHERPAETA